VTAVTRQAPRRGYWDGHIALQSEDTMACTLEVTPSEELNTWLVFLDGLPVTNFNRKFTAPLRAGRGRHRLSYKINGPRGSIKLNIAEEPEILMPEGATWPVTGEVPDGETGYTDAIYFRIA
jgi:hypothetical protein